MNSQEIELKIPPRWLHCPRKGQPIAGKFLPFKTPLDARYNDQIPEENRFDIDMLFMSLKSIKAKMGLLIDLTNTTRFYNKNELDRHDCKYVKLQCRGHGVTPNAEQTATFINVCSHFIKMNPTKMIGVHCTHGFNRTGFLVVAYLVDQLDWSVDAAVNTYAQTRPPGIYKQDYLEDLFKRYGDPEDTPSAPVLPDWCSESDDTDRDDDGNVIQENDGGNQRRRREHVKKDAKFMDGLVPMVTPVTQQPRLGQIQRKTQEMCGWQSSGFPGAQPVSMDVKNLGLLAQKPFKVSWKADGTRYMMLIDGVNEVYMLDRDNSVFHVPALFFPKRKDLNQHITKTLLDGEMIIDTVEGKTVPRYLIYDIIKFEAVNVGGTDFDRRLLCIRREIIEPRHKKMEHGKLDRSREPFSVRAKPFWDITTSKELLDGKFAKEVSHETDGLIFQPGAEPYHCGPCHDMLKWKPPSLNSVDFKLKIVKEHKPGMLPETKGYLCVGSLEPAFGSIKVTKELRDMDNKIIECHWDPKGNAWTFMRQRTDKSFPNSYNTAMSVCASIKDPVTKEKLFDCIDNHRWQPDNKGQGQKRPANDGALMPPPAMMPPPKQAKH